MAGVKRAYIIFEQDIEPRNSEAMAHHSYSSLPNQQQFGALIANLLGRDPNTIPGDVTSSNVPNTSRIVDISTTPQSLTPKLRTPKSEHVVEVMRLKREQDVKMEPIVVEDDEDDDCVITETRWVKMPTIKPDSKFTSATEVARAKQDETSESLSYDKKVLRVPRDGEVERKSIQRPAAAQDTAEMATSSEQDIVPFRRTRVQSYIDDVTTGSLKSLSRTTSEDSGVSESTNNNNESASSESSDDEEPKPASVEPSESPTLQGNPIEYLSIYDKLPADAPWTHAHIILRHRGSPLRNMQVRCKDRWLPDMLVSAIHKYSPEALDRFLDRHQYNEFWFLCRMRPGSEYLSWSLCRRDTVVEVSLCVSPFPLSRAVSPILTSNC